MAICPRCGHKLHIYDWKPNCPECGVNMVYYNSNERLLSETEASEIEHARFQPKVDRAKASTIGSPITWVRLVCSVLVLAVFLIVPLAKVNFTLPVSGKIDVTMNGLNFFTFVTGIDTTALMAMLGVKVFKKALIFLAISIVTLALSVVWIFVSLIALVASLGPKGKQRNIFNHSFQIVLTVISAVSFTLFSSNMALALPYEGSLGWGVAVYLLFFFILLAIDIITAVKGIEVKYTPCLIGGIPGDEYFKMVEEGVSDLEIRKKMVSILTEMQEEFRIRDAEARAKAAAEEEERRSRRKK
ncbi:MAG: hypothetical protein MJ125_01760 [Clostridia bacterium]|nr:hypothetical protein [Clostridia bacterium]